MTLAFSFTLPAWFLYGIAAYLLIGVGVALTFLVEDRRSPYRVHFLLVPISFIICMVAWPIALTLFYYDFKS